MSRLYIQNARIIDPATRFDEIGSILINNGKIESIDTAKKPTPSGAKIIDATGLIAAPGLIDMQVFTGEPGHEYRETLQSASQAAAAGGVTTMLIMPDTLPVIDDASLVGFINTRARDTAIVNILPTGAITKGLHGKDMTEIGLLQQAGARAFTDGRNSIASSAVMKNALTYAANYDALIMQTPRDADLAGQGVMNASDISTLLGLKGLMREVETIPLARDLQLAIATRARYHAMLLSCPQSIAAMRAAKAQSDKITCGISINNLTLNENDIGPYRTFFKLSPPLRSEDERMELIAGLADGTIDVIVSAHDPQDVETKRHPFAEAADGAIGLETLLAAALRLFHTGDVPLMSVLAALTINPAKVLGLDSGTLQQDATADITLFDLDAPWVVHEGDIKSRSQNTPFENALFTGRVMHTIVAGEIVYSAS